MDLSRTEYPALLASLQPDQAVNILNDRVSLINKVNADIADWLQERRKVEEAYVAGLRKLSKRPQQDGAASLGIFQMPWQRIVSGTENMAASHETLAQKIETDVENPLRNFASRNREMQAISTTQGNLGSIARELATAQKKAEKLNAKGSRKADGASSTVDDASRQWESQAPYVFEQLQALDERRVNHLRDVLTQFQTHEVDQVERSRTSAELCLNALLNIETADEIKTFAAKVTSGRGTLARRPSSATASTRPQSSSLHVPPTPPPPRLTEDRSSQRFGSVGGQDRLAPLPDQTPKSKLGGLKRLGTVMGRRKGAAPPPPPTASEKRKEKGRSFVPFRRGDSSRSFQDLESTGQDLTPATSQEPRAPLSREQSNFEPPPGPPPSHQLVDAEPGRPFVNGTSQIQTQTSPLSDGITEQPGVFDSASPPQRELKTPLQPTAPQAQELPPIPSDPISRAQREASLASQDSDEMSRNFAIRDKPIQEDESEAQRAMSNMANQLRLQAETTGMNRVQGSVRGRRDVRNTMFIPSGTDFTQAPGAGSALTSGLATGGVVTAASSSGADLVSPIQRAPPRTIPEDVALGSDTTSVHSSHSLTGLAHHPDLHEPGLNASIVETVNTWFNETGITKSFVTGEIALSYNPPSSLTPTTTTPTESEDIRLSNFQVLEKVAANPMFVNQSNSTTATESTAGTYTISLTSIKRPSPTVGLKYQLHIDPSSLATYSPLLITPAWQLVDGQASVIVLYSLNPAFPIHADGEKELSLKNVLISVSLDASAVKPSSAMMAPQQGASFKRKAGAVVWRFADLPLKSTQEKLLVRFMTPGGTPKKGGVEVKFEVVGRGASSIGIEKTTGAGAGGQREADPFADESASDRASAEQARAGGWEGVPTRKALVSGRYTAS